MIIQKCLKISTVISILLFMNLPVQAGEVSTEFATGDPLTAARMEEVRMAINDNDTRVTTNDSEISSNAADISTNTSGISTNASGISGNASDIFANAQNISGNNSNTSANASSISDNASSISANVTDIGNNNSGISTNASDISNNASDISNNASDISTNASNISKNVSDISTNASDINTNSSDISTNASNISTNASDISANVTNLGTNTSDIGDLQDTISSTIADFDSSIEFQIPVLSTATGSTKVLVWLANETTTSCDALLTSSRDSWNVGANFKSGGIIFFPPPPPALNMPAKTISGTFPFFDTTTTIVTYTAMSTNVSTSDYVNITVTRNEGNASDTCNAGDISVRGAMVTYPPFGSQYFVPVKEMVIR